ATPPPSCCRTWPAASPVRSCTWTEDFQTTWRAWTETRPRGHGTDAAVSACDRPTVVSIENAPGSGRNQGLESWRTRGDSNPRYAIHVYTLSRRAPSTTRPPVLHACTPWRQAKSAILTEECKIRQRARTGRHAPVNRVPPDGSGGAQAHGNGHPHAAHHALDIAGDQVDLQVDGRADFQVAQRRDLHGMGDQVDGDFRAFFLVVHAVDRQADAVDRDRALVGQILRQVGRDDDAQFRRFLDRIEAGHAAHTVDVAGNQVPVQAVAQPQGMLQVDLAGTVQAAGAIQAFARDIDFERIPMQGDDRHAGPLDGDRIAQACRRQRQAAGLDGQAHARVFAIPEGADFGDAAHGRDDTSDHGAILFSNRMLRLTSGSVPDPAAAGACPGPAAGRRGIRTGRPGPGWPRAWAVPPGSGRRPGRWAPDSSPI